MKTWSLIKMNFVLVIILSLSGCQNKQKSESVEALQQRINEMNFQQQMAQARVSQAHHQDTTYNIIWEFTDFDFGQVKQGEAAAVQFTFFVVDGTAQITGSRTYCGCTVPGWEPVKFNTGDSYSILVEFNTKDKNGPFSETVDLFFNRSNTPEKLTVRGFVVHNNQ